MMTTMSTLNRCIRSGEDALIQAAQPIDRDGHRNDFLSLPCPHFLSVVSLLTPCLCSDRLRRPSLPMSSCERAGEGRH